MSEYRTITRRDTIIGLQRAGWVFDANARTRKYDVYRHPTEPQVYLVGRSGALRVIRDGEPVANSRSVTKGTFHHALCNLAGPYQLESTAQGLEVLNRIFDSLRSARAASHFGMPAIQRKDS